jgi:hypothetical protein
LLPLGYCGYRAYRLAKGFGDATKSIHIETGESGKDTSITTPFGKVTTQEGGAGKVAADLGIEVYPGATPVKGSGATVNFGGMTIGGADFESADPIDKVAEFYRSHYPNSTFNSKDENSQAIVVSNEKGWATIAITASSSGSTKISIARMAGGPPKQ